MAGPPCGCDEAGLLDVAAEVAAAKAANQNASIQTVGNHQVTLSSGKYFFSGIDTVGQSTVTIDGAVFLYVEGSIDAVGLERFELTPGSTLDLFVSGDIRSVGSATLGSDADPGAVRLYIGGNQASISTVGHSRLFGSIYAPTADLNLVGDTVLHGALFARSVSGVGSLEVVYSTPVTSGTPPEICPPEGEGDDGGQGGDAPDAGVVEIL
jgi:hypothetical protein